MLGSEKRTIVTNAFAQYHPGKSHLQQEAVGTPLFQDFKCSEELKDRWEHLKPGWEDFPDESMYSLAKDKYRRK